MSNEQIVIIFLLIVIVGLGIYTFVQRAGLRRQCRAIEESQRKHLEAIFRALGQAMGWALQPAASAQLFDSTEKRLLEMVRTYSLELAMVVDPNGQIRASTDKKWEQQPFSSFSNEKLSELRTPELFKRSNGRRMLIAPILSDTDIWLGSVVLVD